MQQINDVDGSVNRLPFDRLNDVYFNTGNLCYTEVR